MIVSAILRFLFYVIHCWTVGILRQKVFIIILSRDLLWCSKCNRIKVGQGLHHTHGGSCPQTLWLNCNLSALRASMMGDCAFGFWNVGIYPCSNLSYYRDHVSEVSTYLKHWFSVCFLFCCIIRLCLLFVVMHRIHKTVLLPF